jgi:hypothetical protein
MTDETIRELCSEHDACIIRARELGDVEIRLRRERFAIREQMEEIIDKIYEREREAEKLRNEYTRRAGMIGNILSAYDERSQS